MRYLSFRQALLTATISLMMPSLAWANSVNTQALELANQKNYTQALNLLLSWAGQYEAAQVELDSLIKEYPGNPDVQLVLGNLAFYQSDYAVAEQNYQAIINEYPNYQDARDGLENVRKARASKQNIQKKWRLDGSVSVTDLTQDGLNDWNNQFLRAEYTPSTLAYSASIQRYDRFGLSDGFTPDSSFRPDFSAGGRLGYSIELENGIVLYPNIDYRYDDFDIDGIHSIQPGLTAYFDKGIVLTSRLIGTVQSVEDNQLGWLVQGRAPVAEKLELNLGYASAPEAIDGLAIDTESFFGGLSYAIRDDFDIHVNLAHDDRSETFSRNSLNVGFTHKR